jgi:hypothetical protein
MWPFKTKRELPLIDLVKYEALLIRMRDSGWTPMPRMIPGDSALPVKYTADELKQIQDNQAVADELWRRYSGQVMQ